MIRVSLANIERVAIPVVYSSLRKIENVLLLAARSVARIYRTRQLTGIYYPLPLLLFTVQWYRSVVSRQTYVDDHWFSVFKVCKSDSICMSVSVRVRQFTTTTTNVDLSVVQEGNLSIAPLSKP
jgi:hypothetical protein